MNTYSSKGSTAAMPLPKSAAAIAYTSGVGSSPGSTGRQRCIHTPAVPTGVWALLTPTSGSWPLSGRPCRKRISIALAAKLLRSPPSGAKVTECPSSRPGRGGSSCASTTCSASSGSSSGAGTSRSAWARHTSTSPSSSSFFCPVPATGPIAYSCASSSCTRRPGRTMRVVSRSGASGTGRRKEKERRANGSSAPGCMCSNALAISVAGAPPCCARGSHGPRAYSVGV